MPSPRLTCARAVRHAGAAIAISLASACASTSSDAIVGEFAVNALRADVAASVCAEIVRDAFPTADDRALEPGAPVRVHDASSFTILYGGDAATVRHAGNAKIALVAGNGALDPLRAEWSAVPSTAILHHPAEVRVEVRTHRNQVRVCATGSLATPSLRARLRADLALAVAIERALDAARHGDRATARVALAPWVGPTSELRPGRRLLARAHAAAAQLELADGDLGRASILLGRALDLDPGLLAARVELARLTDELAQDDARRRQRRTLAALNGNGIAGLGAIVTLSRAASPRGPTDLLRVAQRLASERAPAADLFRVAQQTRDTLTGPAQAEALAVLATAAERLGHPHRAHELHLARALMLGSTAGIVRDLSRTALALGNTERAASLLSAHWSDLQHVPGAEDELAHALSGLPPATAARVLGHGWPLTDHTAALASPPR